MSPPACRLRHVDTGDGWWGTKTDAEAVALLRQSLDDYGMTFFDAADTYGNGRAERQLADAFRGRRDRTSSTPPRSATTSPMRRAVAGRRGQAELPMRTDPASIRQAVDRCLERLETDYIDVLQIHNAKMEHVRDPALWATLRDLQREGKVRVWGAAFGPAIGWLHEAVELCQREPDVGAIQMIWNILEQHPGTAMLDAAQRVRAAVRVHGPRDARVGDARRALHGGHRLSRRRPPTAPAAVVAGERRAKIRTLGFSDDADDAGPGRTQVAAGGAARHLDAARTSTTQTNSRSSPKRARHPICPRSRWRR